MELLESLDINLVEIGLRLLLVFFVIIVGRWFAGTSRKVMLRSLQKTSLTDSLNTLITTLTYYAIMLLTIVVVLAILGVPTTALVTGIGVVLIILAIALQASLGNLAATINFLLFKPFEVGHVVETNGIIGVVQEIQIFSTVLVSLDEKIQILPNSAIQNAELTNYSKNGIIRIDLLFGIGYESDIDKAKQIIEGLLKADGRVLQTPIPLIFVRNLGESSVDIAVWPYVELANFFPFQTDITEKVKKAFDEAGISIPFPQRDVHVRLLKVKS